MSDLTDALESLVEHPGWAHLCAVARVEWTVRERQGRKNALNDTDDKRALDKLRQITAAQEAVEWVLALPNEQIQALKRQERSEPDLPVHRPHSLPNVAAMSRRGSL